MFQNIKKVLAIACVTLAVGAATFPNLVSAQNSRPNTTSRPQKNQRSDAWKKLNLTDAQKAQLKAIRGNAKSQRQNIFTPEQRAKLEQARKSGDRKGLWKSLNLTDAQKQQLKALRETTRTQMKAVLTPAQLQQLEQIKRDRKGARGN